MARFRPPSPAAALMFLGFITALTQVQPTIAAPATQPGTQPAWLGVRPNAAVEQAQQMPKGDARNKALNAAAEAWSLQDPSSALAWALELPRADAAAAQVVFATCIKANPKLTADWVVEQNTTAALGRLHGVIYFWALADHTAAAAWCMGTAPKNVRYLAFFSAGDGWLVKDSAAASAWAASLKSSDDRAAAIHGVALKWGRRNIPEATVWIKTLKPDDATVAAKAIVQDWRANKFKAGAVRDDAAVTQWLEQLPLSDAQKQDVLKGPALPATVARPVKPAR